MAVFMDPLILGWAGYVKDSLDRLHVFVRAPGCRIYAAQVAGYRLRPTP
jgi:hypothetical protein